MLHVPLERDEGGHAYAAWVWSEGGVPYRDSVDNKPPLVLLAYRIAFALFGASTASIHLFMILVALAQAGLMFVLARRYAGDIGGLAAALALSLLSAEPAIGVGNAANTEIFMLLPLLAGVYFLPRSPFLSGLCMGAAVMAKQTAVFEGAAFGAYLLWGLVRERKGWIPFSRYAAGCLAVPALFGAYFWSRGAWPDFFYFAFLYNAEYGSEIIRTGRLSEGLGNLWWSLGQMAVVEWPLWILAAGGLSVLARGKRREGFFLLVWLLAAAAGICSGFRFLSHYFVQAAPALALAAGFGFRFLCDRWQTHPRRIAAAAGLCVLPYLWGNGPLLWGKTPEEISRDLYEPPNPFVESVKVAEYIRENTAPQDRIYVFGSEPQVLFYAGRRSATRYVFSYTLNGDFDKAEALQREAAAELEAARPEMILWVKVPFSHMATSRTRPYLSQKSQQWLMDGSYELEGLVFIGPGQPSRYFLGREKVQAFKPEEAQTAQLLLYRRKM